MPDMKVKMGVPTMIIALIILVAILVGLHYLGVGNKFDSYRSNSNAPKEIQPDGSFYVEQEPIAQVRLIAPKGGESYQVGDSIKIVWETTNWKQDYVQIFIEEQCPDTMVTCAGDRLYEKIDGVPDTGSYEWKIPSNVNPGNHYVVGVGITGMFEHVASNDGYLTITQPMKTYTDLMYGFSFEYPASTVIVSEMYNNIPTTTIPRSITLNSVKPRGTGIPLAYISITPKKSYTFPTTSLGTKKDNYPFDGYHELVKEEVIHEHPVVIQTTWKDQQDGSIQFGYRVVNRQSPGFLFFDIEPGQGLTDDQAKRTALSFTFISDTQ